MEERELLRRKRVGESEGGRGRNEGKESTRENESGIPFNFTIVKQTAVVSEQHVHNRDGYLKCGAKHNDQIHDSHSVDVGLEKKHTQTQSQYISQGNAQEITHTTYAY